MKSKKKSIWKDAASWQLLLLCIPAIVCYVLFHYVPLISGVVLPFKDYVYREGIFGSEWCGLDNFKFLFRASAITRSLRNTVLYSILFSIVGPLLNVIFALLLFELRSRKALKIYQTTIILPNFMSMVVVGYITYAILSPTSGLMNSVLGFFGFSAVNVYKQPSYWPFILTVVSEWKGIGMGSMLYFATLIGIDPTLYEAAKIDGANRWQQTWYISLQHLIPMVCIFTILNIGGLFSGSFDLFYNIPRNVSALYETTDILNTYIVRMLQEGTYSQGIAIGFLQSLAGMILTVTANGIVRKVSPENAMF